MLFLGSGASTSSSIWPIVFAVALAFTHVNARGIGRKSVPPGSGTGARNDANAGAVGALNDANAGAVGAFNDANAGAVGAFNDANAGAVGAFNDANAGAVGAFNDANAGAVGALNLTNGDGGLVPAISGGKTAKSVCTDFYGVDFDEAYDLCEDFVAEKGCPSGILYDRFTFYTCCTNC